MRRYLIATHGTMAAGIQNALQIIMGSTTELKVINAFVGSENPGHQIQAYFETIQSQDEVIIFTDLPGGSVNQMLMEYLKRPHTHLISGVNLCLILSLMLDQSDIDTVSLIHQSICEGRQQIVYINEKMTQYTAEENAFF